MLATGCRERPRSARLVPGSRPEGVITTGTLQQLVYLKGLKPGTRALVVGAEHVSFSALLTLAHGGARAVGMVTELPRHQSLALFRAGARAALPHARSGRARRVSAIHGRARVEEVELTDLDSGALRRVACDTVVFTADWIPDHELAVMAGLAMDAGTRGPAVDAALRTSRPGSSPPATCFTAPRPPTWPRSAGGTRAPPPRRSSPAAAAGRTRASRSSASPRFGWIAPNAVAPGAGAPPRGRFALRSSEFLSRPRIEIAQGGRVLWAGESRGWCPAVRRACRTRGPRRSTRAPKPCACAWPRPG